MRAIVTGAGGILGNALLQAPPLAAACGISFVHEPPAGGFSVDLRDRAAVHELIGRVLPDVVIHTVALTDVDLCEREPATAFATNVGTTMNLVDALAARVPDALIVYISSDQVYSGRGPHDESRVAPLNVYGITKYCGELAALQLDRHLVLRTNFFGPSAVRPSFAEWVELAVRDERTIRLDPQAVFSPLHVADLVDLVGECVDAGATGTFNAGARDSIAKVDLARTLAARVAPGGERFVDVFPDDARRPALRAVDLALDVTRLEQTLGHTLPTVEEGLARLHEERETTTSAG